jgi:hypothetical protein
VSLTPRQARIKLYDHPVIGPHLGRYGTASSVSPTILVDTTELSSGGLGENSFKGQASIVLPGRSGTDREKSAGSLIAGSLFHNEQVNWTSTFTNEPYEIIWGASKRRLGFQRLVEAGDLAMRRVYFRYAGPIGPWKNSDGDDNSDFSRGVNDWTPSGANLTIQASDDAAHNMTGFSSMLLTNVSGADRYVYHLYGVPVQPGTDLWSAVLLKAVSGSGTVAVSWWDATAAIAGSAQLGSTRTTVGAGAEVQLGQQLGIPSNCYLLNMRITIPTGMVVAVDSLPGHDLRQSWFPIVDWARRGYHVGSIQEMEYGSPLRDGVQMLSSRHPRVWRKGIDYDLDNQDENARPNYIQVLGGPGRRVSEGGGLPAASLWLDGLRQESDRIDFTVESALFRGNEDLFMSAYRYEVANMLEGRDNAGEKGRWQRLMRTEEAVLASQRLVTERQFLSPVSAAVRHSRTSM